MKFSQALALVGLLFTCQVLAITVEVDLTGGKKSTELYTLQIGDILAVTVDKDTTGEWAWSPYPSDTTVLSWYKSETTTAATTDDTTTFTYEAIAEGNCSVYMVYLLSEILAELNEAEEWD